ncbi:xanthine dehydrogenase family protein molybdopterin-binding subunit [Sphingomonas sp. KR1UV-12]|uniref:Xanthine dehydrogenase family protein molybdopterin-binding subunit n=1 Tax=Sphingomonas aurea TaxID=3063994 RepID=A0ABT9ENX3_9SPHN|nr:xanthine dehydrogenase family protein molybdopterin-binding subunit [Sphingomonas sp. KR1UV-12]MDP1028520.1 xanthine dehydrogenase family protein molybdopterin-binding subunit [Sphingomonas sp. KR1UV-12]
MFGFGDKTNSLTMNEPVPESLLDTGAQGVISRPLDRVDGPLKVSGTATYAAEYAVPGLVHGVLVGAKIGHGKVLAIDVEAAKRVPGVIDVVVDFDTFIRNAQQGGEEGAPTQGVKQVDYFGQIVAIVLADTYEAAREAALSLPVEYEYKAGTYDFEAHKDEAETPPRGLIPPHYSQGDPDTTYDAAPVKLDVTYVTPSQNSAAMEPHASIAMWEDDALTLYGAYQMPTSDASQLAKSLGVSVSKVRIISRYIGGGFGSKLGIAPESVAAAVAAKQLGRPVKAVMMRQQVFEATPRRSNTEQRIRLGCDADGRIVSFVHDSLVANLPGESFFEPVGIGSHSLYCGENRRINHDMVRLNLGLTGSMRAPGEAVGMVGVECAIDELAEQMGMDPIELRRINDPLKDPEKDVPFSSRMLTRALDEGARRFGWNQRNATPGSRREGEWLVGIGVAAATRNNQLQKSSAKIELKPDGTAVVSSAMTDIGTGSYTIMAQIAAEVLGLPVERIVMKLGDTNDPPAAGSGGSWGAASAGSAVYLAAEALREQLAKAMEVDPGDLTLKDGEAIGGNRRRSIAELVGDGMEATGEIVPGKQEKQFTQASYGAHFAEVGVNVVTGEVRVRRMLGVFAAGRVLNAKTARSQCLGGMTFGIGCALTEDLIHDPRNGKLVNRDLAEYHVPVNADVPQLEVHFLDERDIHANPIHAKGIGELGISGAAPAVVNAIYNACGVRVRNLPVTCDKLLAGLPAL